MVQSTTDMQRMLRTCTPPVDLIELGNRLPRSEPAAFRDLAALSASPIDGPDTSALQHPAARHTVLDENEREIRMPQLGPAPADLLAALHAEYQQAVTRQERASPGRLSAPAQAQITVPLPEDPFLARSGHFTRGTLLDELLGHACRVDTILGQMDPFDAETIFTEEAHHDVLLLLAPPHVRSSRVKQTTLLARREHHLVSADSHFTIAGIDMHSPEHDERNA
ncbi:TagK domain-containing protein [Paraburkholderia aspalathi]|uniref:TagK domain-containing protein n=1 Tax=Paraburkholderia aspalathi TaxID=1324617 RepID=UPI0038BA60C1